MAAPEQIAAAWGAWRVRHKGSMGPGPGFVEAIDAALAVSPAATEIEALRRENQELRRTVEFVQRWAWRDDPPNANNKLTDEERFSAIKWHPSIQIKLTGEAGPARALTMSDIHREQLDRTRTEGREE